MDPVRVLSGGAQSGVDMIMDNCPLHTEGQNGLLRTQSPVLKDNAGISAVTASRDSAEQSPGLVMTP